MTRRGVPAVPSIPSRPFGALPLGVSLPLRRTALAAILLGMKAAIVLMTLSLTASAEAGDWAESARPVYRGVEAVADGVYGLFRGHLFNAVLPGGLSRRMSAVPVGTSDAIFAERLRRRQERAAYRLVELRPVGPVGPAENAAWQRRAVNLHATAMADAMADALIRRYQLERFGQDSGAYASNPANWDAEFAASAGVLGGAYLYIAGVRTDWTLGPVRIDFDTATGMALRAALQNGDGRGLAAVSLRRKDSPLSLRTEWGMTAGRFATETVGVNYSARF